MTELRLTSESALELADSQDDVDRLVYRLIVAYLPLWLVGLAGLFWPLAGLLLLPRLVRSRLNGPALTCAVLFAVLLLSIPVGVLTYGVEVSRVVSAVGNGAVWLALAAFFALGPRAEVVAKALSVLVVFQAVVIVASAVVYPAPFPLPLLHDAVSWAPSGVKAMASNVVFFQDWLGGAAYRSSGIMGNPTWSGALGAIGILISLERFRRGQPRVATAGLLGAGLVALFLSLSRASLGALGLALMAAAVVLAGRRHRHWVALAGLAATTMSLVVILGAWDTLVGVIGGVNEQRTGSLTTRSAIYLETWKGIREHPLPLLGYGVKPQESVLVASVASHSTYLGLVYRMGLLGLVLFVGLLGALARGAVRNKSGLAVALTVFTAVWCVMEDIDTGHVVPLALLLARARCTASNRDSYGEVH